MGTRVRGQDEQDDARGAVGLRLLHSSPEPLINLVFVHGLRGGSTKTWRKGSDPRLFWPQYWLPVESGFHNASIYSFGYESDWASTKPSILNVHDFGQSLFEEMRNLPLLRNNDNVRQFRFQPIKADYETEPNYTPGTFYGRSSYQKGKNSSQNLQWFCPRCSG
jgi:hypothetical protein